MALKQKLYIPVVDRGWSWVVVVGSFFIHVFADGIVYSFGILLEKIMIEFDSTNAKASIIVSLLTGLMLAFGPVASALTNKYGCRATTIAGATLSIVGCLASYFATSVEYLMISVGCVMGMGFGLMYCPAIVSVTMHFEKLRALATGIAVCGAGVGTMLFAPISEALIVRYSWRFVFLCDAGFISLCIICGLTFRPMKFMEAPDDSDTAYECAEKRLIAECGNVLNDKGTVGEHAQNHLSEHLGNANESTSILGIGSSEAMEDSFPNALSNENIAHGHKVISEGTGFLDVKDVFLTGSVNVIPDFNERHDHYRSITSLNVSYEKSGESETRRLTGAKEFWNMLVKLADLGLLKEKIFLLYAISNFLTSISFNSPLVFLPLHANKLGYTAQEAVKIVSAFGLMNTIGRILIGLASDRRLPTKYGKDVKRNRLLIYIVTLSICGLLTVNVYEFKGYYALVVYSGLFGLTLSAYVCLTSVLLVDLIGIERLTNAFGLILLFQGMATIIGPPIAGQLADMTGSYDLSFVFCGAALLASGIMLFAVPLLQRRTACKARQECIVVIN